MNIPKHYLKVSRGFWGVFEADLPSEVQKTFPITNDRYHEIYFAELALSLTPNEDLAPRRQGRKAGIE